MYMSRTCRICMVNDEPNKMCLIVNTNLQGVYEKLTAMPFVTNDGRPLQVCYICCARLRNCYQLQLACCQTEKLFTQILVNKEFKPTLQNINSLKIVHTIALNIVDVNRDEIDDSIKIESVEIKMEPIGIITTDEAFVELENAEDTENNFDSQDSIQHTELKDPLKIDKDTISIKKSEKNFDVRRAQETGNNLKSRYSLQYTGPQGHFKTNENMGYHSGRRNSYLTKSTDETVRLKGNRPSAVQRLRKKSDSIPKKTKRRPHMGSRKVKTEAKKVKSKKMSREKRNIDKIIVNMRNEIGAETGPKCYKCDICEKLFSIKCNLNAHIRIHTGEKPYKCNVCGKYYRQKQHLNVHIRVHSGEKQKRFKCNICEKYFTCKFVLINHIRVHTGEKPYKCDICDKSFSIKDNMKRHTRTHTREKPYKCSNCQKCFSQQGTYLRHTRTHTGEKLFKCEICEKYFSRKNNLVDHARKHSQENVIQK